MRGETRRKARRRYSADKALRRVSPRRRRERRRRERERGRDPEHRAELDQRCHARPRFGSVAERTEAGGGELRRTRPRRRICIRRAGRRTRKSPALHREYRYPNRGRTLTGKPPRHSLRVTRQGLPLRKLGLRCSSGNCRAPSSGCRRSTRRRRRPCACPSKSTPSTSSPSRAGQRP